VQATDPAKPRLRRADQRDATAVADLYLRVRHDNLGPIPAVVHTDDEVRTWFHDVLFARDDIYVAEVDDAVVGFVAVCWPDWVDHLYVLGEYSRSGVGTALLDLVEQRAPGAVQLWAFQSNTGGRRFYERRGYVAVEWTDGDNEEGAPDVRYVLDRSVGPDRQTGRS
jgi:GNAT superfamily N-acetyltransferase